MLSEQDKTDLINRFGIVMDEKIKELKKDIPSRDDMVMINQAITTISEENVKLKEEVSVLRKELSVVRERMKLVDSRHRSDNLIFNGLPHDKDSNLHEIVSSFIKNELGILDDPMIGDIIRLGGPAPGGPLKVKFLRGSFISKIFGKTIRLKDTTFGVDRDYPDDVRAARKKLFLIRKEIMRANGNVRVVIRSDIMTIGKEKFSWSDSIGITYEGKEGTPKLSEIIGIDMAQKVASLRSTGDSSKDSARPSNSTGARGRLDVGGS
ncbi:hypothetical protein GE061_019616 [Apolygus lucorum]|uniref:Uncharacterized protein n=1 Tax=Apolygus lucorum TaxID=248454 RepID=A0A6A4K433_APOLU|nr:hypothetical protein GE061_019616 [Apolygus lucorum]